MQLKTWRELICSKVEGGSDSESGEKTIDSAEFSKLGVVPPVTVDGLAVPIVNSGLKWNDP